MRTDIRQRRKHISLYAIDFLLFVTLCGCASNKVSYISRQPAMASIAASEVKLFPDFHAMGEPWLLEGMISVSRPQMTNTPESRQEIVREVAARLGSNGIVGMLPSAGRRVSRIDCSTALLVAFGSHQPKSASPLPKFIVCMPPAHFKVATVHPQMELQQYLLARIQDLLGFQKGYYVYWCDGPGVDGLSISQGKVTAKALSEPLGIKPEYALLIDVEGLNQQGEVVTNYARTYKITLTLFDLQERKIAAASSSTGVPHEGSLVPMLAGARFGPGIVAGQAAAEGQRAGGPPNEYIALYTALTQAIKTLPSPSGFRFQIDPASLKDRN
jgi:hypothetical protein